MSRSRQSEEPYQTDTLRAHAQGIYFTADDPGNGTPGESEEADEDPDEDDRRPTSGDMVLPAVAERADNTSYNEVTRCHAGCSHNENRLSAEMVHVQHCRDCEDKLQDTHHAGSQQRRGVARKLKTFEHERRVVVDCIYPVPYDVIT